MQKQYRSWRHLGVDPRLTSFVAFSNSDICGKNGPVGSDLAAFLYPILDGWVGWNLESDFLDANDVDYQ